MESFLELSDIERATNVSIEGTWEKGPSASIEYPRSRTKHGYSTLSYIVV